MNARRLFPVLLVLLAAWTAILMYILPAVRAHGEGLSWSAHVRPDGWWVAELALAGLLRRPGPFAWGIALACSVTALLAHLLRVATLLRLEAWTAPEFHGFLHACGVLAVFTGLTGWLVAAPAARRLKEVA